MKPKKLTEPCKDTQILADLLDLVEAQRDLAREVVQRRQVEHAAAVAEQAGREIQQQFVDAAFADQRSVEFGTRFDVDFVELASAELGNHARQVDLAMRIGQDDDFSAPVFQCGNLLAVFAGGEHPGAAAGQDIGGGRQRQLAVDDDAARLARRVDRAHAQLRIVVLDGADAGDDGAGARAPEVAVVARRLAGDPLAFAVVQGGLAVQAGGRFHAYPGRALLHTLEEADVHFMSGVLHQAGHDGDAGGLQFFQAFACDQRVGIGHGRDDLAEAGIDQCIGARRRAAVMAARLQRDVGGGAAHVVAALPRIFHRLDFGMVAAGRLGEAGADDAAVLDDHATDARIGRGGEHAEFGLRQCQRHGLPVVVDVDGIEGQIGGHVKVCVVCVGEYGQLPSAAVPVLALLPPNLQLASSAGLHRRARPARVRRTTLSLPFSENCQEPHCGVSALRLLRGLPLPL